MSFQSRNVVTTQVAYTFPRATVGDTIFYQVSRWLTRTGGRNDLASSSSKACERSGAANFSAHRLAPFTELPLTPPLRSF